MLQQFFDDISTSRTNSSGTHRVDLSSELIFISICYIRICSRKWNIFGKPVVDIFHSIRFKKKTISLPV